MTSENSEHNRYNAPALEKGLDIIELLARESAGLTQVEIARKLSRSVGQVYRMLVALERRNYLHLDPDTDKYTLTLKLFELAHECPPTKMLISAAMPALEEIARTTKQSCHLAVHRDGQVLVLSRVDGPDDISFVVRAGAHFDLLSTSSGHVLLAFQSDEDQQRMLSLRQAATGLRPTDNAALQARIEAARSCGYEQKESMAVRGVTNISAPILGRAGAAIAVMTVTYVDRLDRTNVPVESVREKLLAAANKISRDLGGKFVHHQFVG